MKLSTRGRYGTKALLDLALHNGQEPVPIKDIARRQNIPINYLEHLLTPLVSARIVGSVRGAKGGIKLLKRPADIKLIDVITLLEGSLAPVACVSDPGMCPNADTCVTRDIWDEVKKAIDGVLESTTLQDLIERQEQKGKASPGRMMYHI